MRICLAAALAVCALACGSPRADERDDARAAAPARTTSTAPAVVEPAACRRARRQPDGRTRPADDERVSGAAQKRLNDAGMDFEVVNAGVSGDTSAGGLARLDWALQGDVRVLIVALGGNDGLRGLPVEQLQKQPRRRLSSARRRRGFTVILAGMEAPPNYGRDYIVGVSQGLSRAGEAVPRRARAVPAAGCRRQRVAQPARRHPSDGRGRAHRRRQRVGGAEADLPRAHDRHGRRPGS